MAIFQHKKRHSKRYFSWFDYAGIGFVLLLIISLVIVLLFDIRLDI